MSSQLKRKETVCYLINSPVVCWLMDDAKIYLWFSTVLAPCALRYPLKCLACLLFLAPASSISSPLCPSTSFSFSLSVCLSKNFFLLHPFTYSVSILLIALPTLSLLLLWLYQQSFSPLSLVPASPWAPSLPSQALHPLQTHNMS